MARVKHPVDKAQLAQLIEALETKQEFGSVSALCKAVAESEPGKLLGLTAPIVALRIKEFGIPLKTQKTPKEAPRRAAPAFDMETLKLAIALYEANGVKVHSFEDFLTCAYHDESLNKQRRVAMVAVRKALGVPAPEKTSSQR